MQSINDLTIRGTKPIFIVGMNGSGTTMLADCLNHHPLIYFHSIESKIIPFYYYNIGKFGDLNNKRNFGRLLREFSNNSAFWICNNRRTVEIPYEFNELEHRDLSQVIDLTFSYFSAQKNKVIWGDHSPKYAFSIPVILDLFPEAKIIHIVRDGRDCAQSFRRRYNYNIYRTIYNWKRIVQKARKDGFVAGPERYFEIKYEDLTEFPEKHMNKICSFLEVPFDNQVLLSNMPMYVDKKRNASRIVKNAGKWRKSFSVKEIKKVEDIAGLTLKDFGYDIIYNAGNYNLPQIELTVYKWIDRFIQTKNYCKNYKRKDKLRYFLKYISTSLKQSKVYKN